MKSREYIIAGSLITILIIALALLVILPSISSNPAKKFNEAGALYTKSVDFANEGKYAEALKLPTMLLPLM